MSGKLEWIKDLVKAEQQMEESGVVDFSAGFDPEKELVGETTLFLNKLKDLFVEYSSAFNQLKGIAIGGIKVYGISKTPADFMLFRNGFKLIFAFKKPGTIAVRFQFQGVGFIPGASATDGQTESLMNEDLIEARWGAFGEMVWTHKELPVNLDYLVKYYLSRFIRESAK